MNKREVVWLIIRLIGLYFAYTTIVTLFTLVGSVSDLYSLSKDSSPTQSTVESVRPAPGIPPSVRPEESHQAVKVDPTTEKAKSAAFKTILLYIFLTGLYGGLAFYLVRKGGLLFSLLSSESSSAERRENQTVTTLKL